MTSAASGWIRNGTIRLGIFLLDFPEFFTFFEYFPVSSVLLYDYIKHILGTAVHSSVPGILNIILIIPFDH